MGLSNRETFQSITTDDLDIGGSDFVTSGGYIFLGATSVLQNAFTSSTDYTSLSTATQWASIAVDDILDQGFSAVELSLAGECTSNTAAGGATASFRLEGVYNEGALNGTEFTRSGTFLPTAGPKAEVTQLDSYRVQAKTDDTNNNAQIRGGRVHVWGKL